MGLRRDEVSKTKIRLAVGLFDLLAEEVESRQHLRARLVSVKLHIIADGVRGKEAIDPASDQESLGHDFFQQLLRFSEKFARFLAVFCVIENSRMPPAQFPRVKKRRPVDEGD